MGFWMFSKCMQNGFIIMSNNWREQAHALWGDRWKSTLALTAGVTKRTVQRWNTGHNRPNPEVLEKLHETHKIWK